MGVPGLWQILEPAAVSRSLANLAVVDGFEKNVSGLRGFRVGIDASIWFQHATASKGGNNPEIRCLLFKLLNLSEQPIIPLFMFDGRNRPNVKRGSRKGKSGSHNLSRKMKEMLEICGMEWRVADGEAEAELAYLSSVGVLDAVLTDDVDTLLFGARMVINNLSTNLSGNRSAPALNAEGKAKGTHCKVYSADAIRNHPSVCMTRGGMILIAILSGGDYDDGLSGCGPETARALALCGFGDQLLDAYQRGPAYLAQFLPRWRMSMCQEVRTNSQKHLSRARGNFNIPDTFPDLGVMQAYMAPACKGQHGGGRLRDRGNLNLARIAAFCEAHFDEWGHRSAIIKRFRTLVWDSAVVNVLRRAALAADEKEKQRRIAHGRTDLVIHGILTPSASEAPGVTATLVQQCLASERVAAVDRAHTYADIFVNRGSSPLPNNRTAAPSPIAQAHPLLKAIINTRTHVSTDHLLDYRVVVDPTQLVDLTLKGIHGKHSEPVAVQSSQGSTGASSKGPPHPHSDLRLWLPASMVRQAEPRLVQDFEAKEEAKRLRKSAPGRKRRAAVPDINDSEDEFPLSQQSQASFRSSQQPVPPSSSPPPSSPLLLASSPPRGPSFSQPVSSPTRKRPSRPASQPRASSQPPRAPPSRRSTKRQDVPSATTSTTATSSRRTRTRPAPEPRPDTPDSSDEPPSRLWKNVGWINGVPDSTRGFLFTFTNPDDPDFVLESEEKELERDDEPPTLLIADANLPQPNPPTPALNRAKGKQRELPSSSLPSYISAYFDGGPPPMNSCDTPRLAVTDMVGSSSIAAAARKRRAPNTTSDPQTFAAQVRGHKRQKGLPSASSSQPQYSIATSSASITAPVAVSAARFTQTTTLGTTTAATRRQPVYAADPSHGMPATRHIVRMETAGVGAATSTPTLPRRQTQPSGFFADVAVYKDLSS